jgi:hypothetical protein
MTERSGRVIVAAVILLAWLAAGCASSPGGVLPGEYGGLALPCPTPIGGLPCQSSLPVVWISGGGRAVTGQLMSYAFVFRSLLGMETHAEVTPDPQAALDLPQVSIPIKDDVLLLISDTTARKVDIRSGAAVETLECRRDGGLLVCPLAGAIPDGATQLRVSITFISGQAEYGFSLAGPSR